MRRARISGIGLLLAASVWPACREVTVCENAAECSPSSFSGAGDGFAPSASDGGTSGAPDGAGSRDGGTGSDDLASGGVNAGASGAAGEAVGGVPAIGPHCAAGTDDCDDSTLTVCETPTSLSFRHCGACNARCDGACSVGKCKQGELLLDKGVQRFAANATAAFALVSAPNDRENLHRFDVDSGADAVLADALESGADLLLGADRIYLHYSDVVVSMGLDGSGTTTEAFTPEGLGVTKAGVYYTSYVTDPETEDDIWTLWFRPQAASAFTAISTGKECHILGSSREALLVQRETAGTAEILLARGSALISLGDSPGEAIAAAPADDGAVFLRSSETAASGYELVWLAPEETPEIFELEAAPEDFNFVPAPGGVALLLEDRHNTFVRIFSRGGTEAAPLGIPSTSTLAYVDERYVWYSWFGAPDLSQRFVRARQFEPNDLLPSE